ncbi:MAG TPA: GspE/PulE family protein [bacterium]|nr:GspE/PulE family protein [bacterium]
MSVKPHTKLFGDLLLETGIVTAQQLAQGLERQRQTGERLGRALIALGVREEKIAEALARQLNLPLVKLHQQEIDPAAASLLSETLARKYTVVPVERTDSRLTLAMADPIDVVALDDVSIATGLGVTPVIATVSDVKAAIERVYGIREHARGIIEEIAPAAVPPEEAAAEAAERSDAPVIRLADLILDQAIRDRASDVHIEPTETEVRVRYRIDGVLHTAMTVPRQVYIPLVARFKVMGRMNVAEHRVPQDGSFQITTGSRAVDFRVSTIPVIHGERVALRVLDKSQAILTLPQLGMDDATLARYQQLIGLPYGIILVSGPTGSGKTTTLVSSIAMLNALERNIMTVEDPVEYQIPGVSQMEVNVRAGLTFANALRSLVRQDPDVLMVGEIRDTETAEIATHASLTGHLVFSTIHTNDAPSVITRLLDMGVEPFLIASSLSGAVAQRLVRVLCADCKRRTAPLPEVDAELRGLAGEGATVEVYEPGGCPRCRNTGYRGRTGIYELLTVTPRLRPLIIRRASAEELAVAARADGMATMRENGLRKVAQGRTTLEEVVRSTRVVDVE